MMEYDCYPMIEVEMRLLVAVYFVGKLERPHRQCIAQAKEGRSWKEQACGNTESSGSVQYNTNHLRDHVSHTLYASCLTCQSLSLAVTGWVAAVGIVFLDRYFAGVLDCKGSRKVHLKL
jgi:hypothetical protein